MSFESDVLLCGAPDHKSIKKENPQKILSLRP